MTDTAPLVRRSVLAGLTAALLTLTGCGATGPQGLPAGATAPALAASAGTSTMPAPSTCTIRRDGALELPDPRCTPGAVNPAVTPATINATICRTGWTKTVRPATSVTNPMKRASAAAYGQPAGEQGEYDHLVPLELGGATQDSRNLWFERGSIPNRKDQTEHALNEAVCAGRVTLEAAQRAIAANWATALEVLDLRITAFGTCEFYHSMNCVARRHGDGS